MRTNTSTLLVLAYAAIALVVILMMGLMGLQYQKTQTLLAELNSTESKRPGRVRATNAMKPRQSMRPALLRLERLLEARTQKISVQQSQLKQQISGREKLQQKYEQLSGAYEKLLADHRALAKEVEFYLSAVGFAYDSMVQQGEGGESTLEDNAAAGPELQLLFGDDNDDVVDAAAKALAKIGNP